MKNFPLTCKNNFPFKYMKYFPPSIWKIPPSNTYMNNFTLILYMIYNIWNIICKIFPQIYDRFLPQIYEIFSPQIYEKFPLQIYENGFSPFSLHVSVVRYSGCPVCFFTPLSSVRHVGHHYFGRMETITKIITAFIVLVSPTIISQTHYFAAIMKIRTDMATTATAKLQEWY